MYMPPLPLFTQPLSSNGDAKASNLVPVSCALCNGEVALAVSRGEQMVDNTEIAAIGLSRAHLSKPSASLHHS